MENEKKIEIPTKEEFSAMPMDRQAEVISTLIEKGDLDTVKALGYEIIDDVEFVRRMTEEHVVLISGIPDRDKAELN